MTPQQCLEARLRLGWSRQDLAEAAGLAAPIVRLFEAGALAGFDDCEAALAEALMAAEAEPEPLVLARGFAEDGPRPLQGALIWSFEAHRSRGTPSYGALRAN
jgi:transcriptional regulator with XRE-family HTH domain